MTKSKLAGIFRQSATALVVALLGLALSVVLALLTARQLEREARLEFDRAASDAQVAIEARINAYADVLRGVRALFIANESVSRAQFRRYIDSLNLERRYPGIQVIHYSRRISAAERPAFVAAVRADTSVDPRGYPQYAIKPAGERAEYVVAQYVEPMAGNQGAMGLDLGGDAVRLAALERTRLSGRLTASGTIALALDPSRHPGFAMRIALYRNGAPLDTEEQRREALTGVASTSFIVIDLMRGVLSEPFLQKIHVRIHDAGYLDRPGGPMPPDADNLLFDSDRLLAASTRRAAVGAGEPERASTMEVGGRRWDLYFSRRAEPGVPIERWLPWIVLMVGCTFSALLYGLTHSLATASSRAVELADRITADLRASEARYRSVVAAIAEGVLLRDRDGRIVTCNASAERILGRKLEELKGNVYFAPGWRNTIREDGSPFPEEERPIHAALRTGQLQSGVVMGLRRDDGSVLWLSANAQPLFEEPGAPPSGVVTTITDITERRQAELRQTMEHKVTRLLSQSETLEEFLPKSLQTIGEALGCVCGACWLRDESGETARRAAAWHVSAEEIVTFMAQAADPLPLPLTTGGPIGRAWRGGEPVWIGTLPADPNFRRAPHAAAAGLNGAFAFPIGFENEIFGVMEFFSRESRPPDEALANSTRSIGSQIGQFMARRRAEARVRRLANYDELTGLPNRSMFHQSVGHALAGARRQGSAVAILFIDVDRFKNVNDTLGHEAGDRVLKEIGARLRGSLRESDTVGRLGGDEFVVLAEGLAQADQVAAVAQKLLAAVARPLVLGAQEIHLTASVGISTCPGDSADIQGLMKNADIAMYRAKDQGGNNYQFYSAQMNVHTLERLALEADLRRALARNEFVLHFQPKVDIASGRLAGAEALVRWQPPGRPLVPPGDFIPLAEESGLITSIGEWVMRAACVRNKAWRDKGLPPVRVAVNLSARQFAQDSLVQDVARVLAESDLDPAALEVEITESMVMLDPERAVRMLDRLRKMGVRLSIDDFGTGHSSLAYLKRFPIDSVKIDGSFIRDLPGDADDAAITEAIIALAHSLRLKVIAEGVETEAQLRFLRARDCDELQGYYFSSPVPEDEFLTLLSHSTVMPRA